MKINEIPEKIYLSYETDDEDYKDHIFIDYMWHRHPFEGKNLKNIEYIRKDAFIENVYDWIRKGGNGCYLTSEFGEDTIDFVKLAEDFKKYVEGGKP